MPRLWGASCQGASDLPLPYLWLHKVSCYASITEATKGGAVMMLLLALALVVGCAAMVVVLGALS